MIVWERTTEDRAIRSLGALGLALSEDENKSGFLHIEGTSALTGKSFETAVLHLQRLAPRLIGMALRFTPVTDITPLSGLTVLQSLSLPNTISAATRLEFDKVRRAQGLSPLFSQ